jgi:hypothetical protein
MAEIHNEIVCGALKSPDDIRDWIFEHVGRGANDDQTILLPDEYDLRIHSPPARNQGRRGTCAAFTAAAIKEIQESIDCGFKQRMSPEFIYYHRMNKPGNGMYGRNVFQILQKIGCVPEHMYPYCESDAKVHGKPTKMHYEHAGLYRIANYARVTTIDGLKHALYTTGPCYILLPLYKTRPEFWMSDGKTCSGGHAVAVVGYTKTGFILKNSWGVDWNGDGCIIFPYNDWPLHWECWAPVDEKTRELPKSESKSDCTIC